MMHAIIIDYILKSEQEKPERWADVDNLYFTAFISILC